MQKYWDYPYGSPSTTVPVLSTVRLWSFDQAMYEYQVGTSSTRCKWVAVLFTNYFGKNEGDGVPTKKNGFFLPCLASPAQKYLGPFSRTAPPPEGVPGTRLLTTTLETQTGGAGSTISPRTSAPMVTAHADGDGGDAAGAARRSAPSSTSPRRSSALAGIRGRRRHTAGGVPTALREDPGDGASSADAVQPHGRRGAML